MPRPGVAGCGALDGGWCLVPGKLAGGPGGSWGRLNLAGWWGWVPNCWILVLGSDGAGVNLLVSW